MKGAGGGGRWSGTQKGESVLKQHKAAAGGEADTSTRGLASRGMSSWLYAAAVCCSRGCRMLGGQPLEAASQAASCTSERGGRK